jgi:hypothetical protein
MNTKKLAELIYSVAQYEGYNTSVLQTQKNLSTSKEFWEFASESDKFVFEDLVRAIHFASQHDSLTLEVFKGINAQMNSKADGQPEEPGVLRKDVPIFVGDYMPPKTVTPQMVERELSAVTNHTVEGAWELYARLAKLQAFDNGNKRTALISANLFYGSLSGKKETVLTIPTDYRRAQFDANLMFYYVADDWDDHMPDVAVSLKQFVTYATDLTRTEKTFEQKVEQGREQQKVQTEKNELNQQKKR